MKYHIIRHSNTRLILTDRPDDGSNEISEIELTLESSYQRDLFALVFQRMNDRFLQELSKSGDLHEIDFYKRREAYLEKQMTQQQRVANIEIKKLKQVVVDREKEVLGMKEVVEQMSMESEDHLERSRWQREC
jgi:hypothetical protein